MAQQPYRDRCSLDSRAFTVVLTVMFICTLLCVMESVVGEAEAEPVVIAVPPSQLQCARL